MSITDDRQRDRIFLKLFLKSSPSQLSDEEFAYFLDHPELIDEVTVISSP